MRIFVLEDDPERIVTLVRFFDHQPNGVGREVNNISWAATNFHVDRFKPPYDLILLNHDLGGRQMVTDEDNGLTFLKAIRENLGNALVIGHSWNLAAAARMKQEWPSLVLAPFNEPRFWTLLTAVLR